MLNKDNWALGIVLGILLPLVTYAVLLALLHWYNGVEGLVYTPRPRAPGLVAVFSNLFPFRYYMVSKKYDKTGRGILLVTFALAIVFFYFFM